MTLNFSKSLYMVALAHLALELSANFLPVVYPLFITNMGLTYAQVGFIALIFGLGSSLSQPLFGYLSDIWGPHRITVLSILWIGLIMGLVGFAWSYMALLALVGLGSLGSGAFHPAGASIASANSGARQGAGLSIFSVGGNLGSALSPLWVAVGLTWLGLPGTGLLIPVALLMGVLLFQHLGSDAEYLAGSSSQDTAKTTPRPNNGSLLGLALIIVAVMCRNWFQVSLVTYLPEWIQSQGWTLAAGGQFLSIFLVSISVGSLVGGALSDQIGRWQVVALSLGLLGPTQWLFMASTGFVQIGLAALMGVLVGCSFPVAIVMAQEAWPQGVGMASALVLGLGWLPGGIGASVTGFIADQSSLDVGLQALIIPPVIGLLCALFYAISHRRATPAGVLPDIQ